MITTKTAFFNAGKPKTKTVPFPGSSEKVSLRELDAEGRQAVMDVQADPKAKNRDVLALMVALSYDALTAKDAPRLADPKQMSELVLVELADHALTLSGMHASAIEEAEKK